MLSPCTGSLLIPQVVIIKPGYGIFSRDAGPFSRAPERAAVELPCM